MSTAGAPLAVVEHAGSVATITLNRPKALNALDRELAMALRDAVLAAEAAVEVRCLVIRGGEHFMAGGDLRWFAREIDGRSAEERKRMFLQFIAEVHQIIAALRRMPKPVLASVRGAAAGFGLSLALACDLVLASDDAYFTLAYSLIGASPDGGSTFALPRVVGARKAMEISLLGERFDAAAAERLGIVNRVVPPAALEAETAKLAQRLAAGPARAYARTKALLNRAPGATLEDQLEREAEAFAQCAAEPDFAEGLAAFLEKRKARFA
jgi:2-(1,2-epoxy-1,2-dihydrophenyl)acetyl-CoA isomerase